MPRLGRVDEAVAELHAELRQLLLVRVEGLLRFTREADTGVPHRAQRQLDRACERRVSDVARRSVGIGAIERLGLAQPRVERHDLGLHLGDRLTQRIGRAHRVEVIHETPGPAEPVLELLAAPDDLRQRQGVCDRL